MTDAEERAALVARLARITDRPPFRAEASPPDGVGLAFLRDFVGRGEGIASRTGGRLGGLHGRWLCDETMAAVEGLPMFGIADAPRAGGDGPRLPGPGTDPYLPRNREDPACATQAAPATPRTSSPA